MGRPFKGKNVTEHLSETNVPLRRRIFKESALIMNGNEEEEKKMRPKGDEEILIK